MNHQFLGGIAVLMAGATLASAAQPIVDLPVRRQFDFWTGQWDVTNRFWNAERGETIVPGAALRVYPILDGGALVEHYRGRSATGGDILGFSVRAYDPVTEQWVIVLNWPSADAPFWTMEGGFDVNRGVFFGESEQPDGRTRLGRYIFSDLLPGFYRWEGSVSFDDGATWARPSYVMDGARRAPDAEPFDDAWLHGEDIDQRCPGDERRALDFMDGSWEGSTRVPQADGTTIEFADARIESRPILAGCARMNLYTHTGAENTEYGAFSVFAYDAQHEVWVAYLTTGDGVFHRQEGRMIDGELHLERTRDDGAIERFRWSAIERDSYEWEGAESRDGGATWTVFATSTFRRTE